MWKRLFKGGSSIEGGTLQQLRNLICRRNISSNTKISSNVNAVEDFLFLVIKCHLIAATLHYFSMESVNDTPKSNGFSEDFKTLPWSTKKQLVFNCLFAIVDRYVIPQQFHMQYHHQTFQLSNSDNPHAMQILQEHIYLNPPIQGKKRRLPKSNVYDRPYATVAVKQVAVDGVLNYATAVLNDGLLLLEYQDAIREGDGIRLLRCWKALLLYFHVSGHHNYAKEAVNLLAFVNATGTPRLASQVMWSRVVNTVGKKGRNIPVDLHNEHINQALKDAVCGLGANVTRQSILQCGKSLNGLMTVTKLFDKEHGIHKESTKHSKMSPKKDEQLILNELVNKSAVFNYIPGRYHQSFPSIKPNIAQSLKIHKTTEWINKHLSSIQTMVNVAKLYGHNT